MTNDRTTIHIVVLFIGLIAITLAGGMLFLNSQSMKIDPVLSATAAGALGALTALLASTKAGTSAVSVVNPDPIPVTTTPEPASAPAPVAAPEVPVGTDLPVTDLTGA